MPTYSTVTGISARLAAGRQALEELIAIASELEKARAGLENSASLNVASAYLPPAVRRIWRTLDSAIQALSREELLAKLEAVERLLAARLEGALGIVDAVCAAAQRGEKIKIDGFRGTLADVSRQASTALAIRIMARHKNYALTPAALPIAAETLREKVAQIRVVERTQQRQAVAIIDDMSAAAQTALQSTDIDATRRAQLLALSKDLQTNKRHLADGGNFEALPVAVAAIQIPVLPAIKASARANAYDKTQTTQRSRWSIWRRQLKIWLDTPFGVTWREAGRRARADN